MMRARACRRVHARECSRVLLRARGAGRCVNRLTVNCGDHACIEEVGRREGQREGEGEGEGEREREREGGKGIGRDG